jgi:16S rRNA (adenine1518-N6/adenine1519-N6)-dimethyltransferase
MRARKRFGQHFLTDSTVLARILAAVNPRGDDKVLEIGPGHAALTELLYPDAGSMVVVDIDRDLIAMLRARFNELEVVNADILKFDLDAALQGSDWRLVGNLPYNISSPLLAKLYGHLDKIRDMHFMFQRELSERLAAVPGTKDWGRLSVLTQYFCHVQPLFDVPPDAFHPPPKVESQVIRLWPRAERRPVDQAVLALVLRTGFSARRKRLSNALKPFGLDWDALEELGIAQSQRPDQLGVDDYVNIACAVEELQRVADQPEDSSESRRNE